MGAGACHAQRTAPLASPTASLPGPTHLKARHDATLLRRLRRTRPLRVGLQPGDQASSLRLQPAGRLCTDLEAGEALEGGQRGAPHDCRLVGLEWRLVLEHGPWA